MIAVVVCLGQKIESISSVAIVRIVVIRCIKEAGYGDEDKRAPCRGLELPLYRHILLVEACEFMGVGLKYGQHWGLAHLLRKDVIIPLAQDIACTPTKALGQTSLLLSVYLTCFWKGFTGTRCKTSNLISAICLYVRS